jgi:hypothetical protein
MKKTSKTKLIKNIIDYVFNTYCDDETIAEFANTYYEFEKKAEERKTKKNIMIEKSQYKCRGKIYKITQPVRDFLEPLVDAEYFKHSNFKCIPDAVELYDAMEQLETRQHKKLLKQIEKKRRSDI